VGCIPKKIMHYAGLLGHQLRETHALGWQLGDSHSDDGKRHDWKTLVHNVGDYIKGLNLNYKVTGEERKEKERKGKERRRGEEI